ncbi:hypothetical protein [Nocardioides sp.]|nr:hypothetical protein [Nocardioides sp.]
MTSPFAAAVYSILTVAVVATVVLRVRATRRAAGGDVAEVRESVHS